MKVSNILSVVKKLISISCLWRKTESDYKEGCIGMRGKDSLVHGFALRVKRLCRLFSLIHIYDTVVRSAWKDVQQLESVAQ